MSSHNIVQYRLQITALLLHVQLLTASHKNQVTHISPINKQKQQACKATS